ncbi:MULTISPECIES: ABC transporter transmembrane domain-containing protein [Exiguobacterium]|uniref:ABC transporter transmembrane domain-containing protein n=1 Tax=Exiguobacterium TaxID=33986 RepID=UPI000877753C|nr:MULTISPECIES: ABC transporter transmembrane domain-containing protein [Exiguobacterium]TCI47559.1 ATP-binding cassette domain-containing protein [Exiguobacterium sp. SH5S32]TCI54443.1 ATP-binding cassette domain-containing protein [Exiguobacterium sp. SH1S4]TCI65051.1 ATP-binding cassette domain-containing protein [Exiguobacterium sp. SH0S2]TCI72975.1 ATP-binding cassette domain-containing protein [Exiguobacterium sp. SH0S7]TCI74236.1 ATP-binding cassette domain-containing protein [Exiguoba
MRVFKQLAWFFRLEWRTYAVGIVLLMFVAALELIPPRIIGRVIDGMNQGSLEADLLWMLLGGLAAVGIGNYVARFFWRYFIFGASIRLGRLLRSQLYRHFTDLDQRFYKKSRVGDLMAHATNDVQAVSTTAGAGILTLVDSVTMGTFVIITMVTTISWKLTVVALLPLPIMVILTTRYGKMLHSRFGVAQAAFSELNDKVQESVSGVRVLKSTGEVDHDVESFEKLSDEVMAKNVRVAKIDALYDPTIFGIVGLSYILSIGYGAYLIEQGELTIGQIVSFTAYLSLLTWPMLAFGWLFNIVERGRASYDRIERMLAIKPEIQDDPMAATKLDHSELEADIGSFRYDDTTVLRDVTFRIERGKTLGIVGRTGSGKTTIVRLLTREYDVTDGKIKIGGVNVRQVKKSLLLDKVALVPQDHFLFSDSIASNIAFGKPEAKMDEIMEAAKIAEVHDDILRLPEGYATLVGERGVTLSGGQKQRISIARALMIEADLLILDDALSAVDAKTEEAIIEHFRVGNPEQSRLIVAHRLSAVEHADEILVLADGQVIQRGRHNDLIREPGWYKETYDRQQLEAIVEGGGHHEA